MISCTKYGKNVIKAIVLVVVHLLSRIINLLLTDCHGFFSVKAVEIYFLNFKILVLDEEWLVRILHILGSQVLIDLVKYLPGDVPSLRIQFLS